MTKRLDGKCVLIIPDIHTNFIDAEEIIDKEKPDKTLFLGDYFDSFTDSIEITYQVAEWLKESLEKKDRVHLLGNHDLSYLNQNFLCAGFSQGKLYAIKKSGVDLNKLKHYWWVDDWLCTHAGLSNSFFNAYRDEDEDVINFLMRYEQEQKERLYDRSDFRGGRNAYGGILWCDWNEFEPITNIKQIFGHTNGRNVRNVNDNYCIDTGGRNYAIYENNEIKIKESRT